MDSINAVAGPSSPAPASSSTSAQSGRLYIGNLSPTVDEYTLLQIFSKFGKVTKLDFMFHKTGVQKGKPRGYAFIEFSSKDDASKAMTKLHDRLLRGRKLVVTAANSAPINELPLPHKGRRYTEQPKTTTLSLLKSRRHPQSTDGQIAAMEAKLAAMDRTKPKDEDYVPGSRAFPLSGGAGTSSTSGSASPAVYDHSPRRPIGSPDAYYVPPPDEDMHPENTEANIGDAEAAQAAEDLEKEFRAEFATVDESKATSRQSDTSNDPAVDVAAISSLNPPPMSGSLPPRPTESAAPALPNPRQHVREKAFQQGLAGLPKRPAFIQ